MVSSNTMVFGVSLAMIGIPGIYAICAYKNKAPETAKAQPQYELRVQDLNGNGIPEKFYEIDGKRVFLEIDGKSIENTVSIEDTVRE